MDNYEQIKAEILTDLTAHLKPSRLAHVMGVAETAVNLAPVYGIDPADAEIAALLHDNAKYMSLDQLLAACGPECGKYHLSALHGPVLHAFAGAKRAEEMYPYLSEDIINAVRFHTTGRPAMSKLEMLIFIADYIEPGREPFEGLSEARTAAAEGLEGCMELILGNTYRYLASANRPIHPLNREAYSYYKNISSQKGKDSYEE